MVYFLGFYKYTMLHWYNIWLKNWHYFKCLNCVEIQKHFVVIGVCGDSCYPAGGSRERIQTVEVVVMAAMVPMGIDFWASRRSPERLEPAMIPEQIVEKQTLSRSRRFTHTHTHTQINAARVRSSRISIHSFNMQNTDSEASGIVNDTRNVIQKSKTNITLHP